MLAVSNRFISNEKVLRISNKSTYILHMLLTFQETDTDSLN
jgi:hypothetical protein